MFYYNPLADSPSLLAEARRKEQEARAWLKSIGITRIANEELMLIIMAIDRGRELANVEHTPQAAETDSFARFSRLELTK